MRDFFFCSESFCVESVYEKGLFYSTIRTKQKKIMGENTQKNNKTKRTYVCKRALKTGLSYSIIARNKRLVGRWNNLNGDKFMGPR